MSARAGGSECINSGRPLTAFCASVITWHSREGKTYISIKEHSADFAQLKPALDALDVEIVDVRQYPECNQKQYG